MKLRIIQKPSLSGDSRIHWYHAQVRRFGIWVNCRDDFFMMIKYSTDMMAQSYDTSISRVENFIDFVLRGEDMFDKSRNKVVKEYHT